MKLLCGSLLFKFNDYIIYMRGKNQIMNLIESDSSNKEGSAYETKMSSEYHSFNNTAFNKLERIQTMKDIKEMNKKELVELTCELQAKIKSLIEENLFLANSIDELKSQLEASSKDGRKSQVLALLREYKTISILEIANKLNISTKNVSSQLTYLRQDKHQIFTDPNGRKMLVEATKDEADSSTE